MVERWRDVNSMGRAITGLLVTALLLVPDPQRAFSADKLICILGGTGTRHAIPVLASTFGLYPKYGLDATIWRIGSGTIATAALLGGEADVINTSGPALINARLTGTQHDGRCPVAEQRGGDEARLVRPVEAEGEGLRVFVEAPDDVLRYCVEKGSVTVDGVSLTVAELADDAFAVALVPHTLEVTTLSELAPGRQVNLEVDVLAKYVERVLSWGRRPPV